MKHERKAIIQVEVLHALGQGVDAFWRAVLEGHHPASMVLESLEQMALITEERLRRMDRVTRLLTLCTKTMVNRLRETTAISAETMGICTSTHFSIFNSIMEFMMRVFKSGPGRANPMDYPNTAFNACSGYACIESQIKGYNNTLGEFGALGEAFDALVLKRAQLMVSAGVDELSSYQQQLIDTKASGLVNAEGAAALLMSADSAVKPLAWYLGYAAHYSKLEANRADIGLETKILTLLERHQLSLPQIDGVVLSTSTHRLDDYRFMLGDTLFQHWSSLPVFHVESTCGLLGGAAETMAAVIATQILATSIWPGQQPKQDSPYDHRERSQSFSGKRLLVMATDPWGLTTVHLLVKD